MYQTKRKILVECSPFRKFNGFVPCFFFYSHDDDYFLEDSVSDSAFASLEISIIDFLNINAILCSFISFLLCESGFPRHRIPEHIFCTMESINSEVHEAHKCCYADSNILTLQQRVHYSVFQPCIFTVYTRSMQQLTDSAGYNMKYLPNQGETFYE